MTSCSTEDPIFGHASLGSADELWSKDVTSSPEKSFPLSVDNPSLGIGAPKVTSEHFEVKSDYLSDQNQSFGPAYEKLDLFTSNASGDSNSGIESVPYTGDKNKLSMKQKVS